MDFLAIFTLREMILKKAMLQNHRRYQNEQRPRFKASFHFLIFLLAGRCLMFLVDMDDIPSHSNKKDSQ